tara:strand:+ start:950 stop:1516 length:567 start_codon:yes stop_codon:yes gene_type:complete
MIIGITGKIGSGKSTLAEMLVKEGYTEYSFAQPLKKIGEIFGFSKEQLYGTQEQKLEKHSGWGISSRQFLQKIGTELFREQLPKILPEMNIQYTVWVDLFRERYRKNKGNYVISDVRFIDEEKAIRQLGGVIIRTQRDNKVTSKSKKEHQHKSEMEQEQIKYDYLVNNNMLSKEEVRDYVKYLVQTLQ